ncbi:hypothetical protein ES288_A01G124500v1 [Gossypium darwinii]|uniref:Uncharacterized protein n=1 Tax=Gossypium darwinii TaxID=34276 RepID=A0A5D2HKJ4_GOSDA|nr:hypothetical protein ES288_A01G124500v1 [Gossypium darwinii]
MEGPIANARKQLGTKTGNIPDPKRLRSGAAFQRPVLLPILSTHSRVNPGFIEPKDSHALLTNPESPLGFNHSEASEDSKTSNAGTESTGIVRRCGHGVRGPCTGARVLGMAWLLEAWRLGSAAALEKKEP